MKVTGYWVYTITAPNGDVYVGMSGREYTGQRCQSSNYKTNSLHTYIENYGWDNLKKEVVKDGMTKEEASELEDKLIVDYTEIGICINKNRSGLITYTSDYYNNYNRKYRDEHKDEIKELKRRWMDEHKDEYRENNRQYRYEHKEEIRERNRRYRDEHKDEIKELKRRWMDEHNEEHKEYCRRYYYEHKDEYRERARRYYQRKKEEKQLKELGYIKLF